MERFSYTNRDYESIKESLKRRAQKATPEWTDFSENDPGMVLIELFASMGDMLSYSIDRIANECFLPTAMERQSILNMAKLTGYIPSGAKPARSVICLKWDEIKKSIDLPLHLIFSVPNRLMFEFNPAALDSANPNILAKWPISNGEEINNSVTPPSLPVLNFKISENKIQVTSHEKSNTHLELLPIENVFAFAVANIVDDGKHGTLEKWHTLDIRSVLQAYLGTQRRQLVDLRLYQIRLDDPNNMLRPILFRPQKEGEKYSAILLQESDLYLNLHDLERMCLQFKLSLADSVSSLFLVQYIFGKVQEPSDKDILEYCIEKNGIVLYRQESKVQSQTTTQEQAKINTQAATEQRSIQIQYYEREDGQTLFCGTVADGIRKGILQKEGDKYSLKLSSDFYSKPLEVKIQKKSPSKETDPESKEIWQQYPNTTVSHTLNFPAYPNPVEYTIYFSNRIEKISLNDIVQNSYNLSKLKNFGSTHYGFIQKVEVTYLENKFYPVEFVKKEKEGEFALSNDIPNFDTKKLKDGPLLISFSYKIDKSGDTYIIEALQNTTSTEKPQMKPISGKAGEKITISVPLPFSISQKISSTVESDVSLNGLTDNDEIWVYTQRILKSEEPLYYQNFPWPEKENVLIIPWQEFSHLPQYNQYNNGKNEIEFLAITMINWNKDNEIISKKLFSHANVPTKLPTSLSIENALLSPNLYIEKQENIKPSCSIYLPVIQGILKKKTIDKKKLGDIAVSNDKKVSCIAEITCSSTEKKLAEDGFEMICKKGNESYRAIRCKSLWECMPREYHYYVEWNENNAMIFVSQKFPILDNIKDTTEIDIFYRECEGSLGNFGATEEKSSSIQLNINAKKTLQPDFIWNPMISEGGRDEESLEDIRANIPHSIARRERLVTWRDYEALLKEIKEIAYFQIVSSLKLTHEITIYIAPESRMPLCGYVNALVKKQLYEIIQTQKMLTTRVNLLDPRYVDIKIDFKARIASNVMDEDGLKKKLQKDIAQNINRLSFQSNVDIGDIYKTIMSYPEVRYIENPSIKRIYVIQGRMVRRDMEKNDSIAKSNNISFNECELESCKINNEIEEQFLLDPITGYFTWLLENLNFSSETNESNKTNKEILYWKFKKEQTNIIPYFFELNFYPFQLIKQTDKKETISKKITENKQLESIRLEYNELPRIIDIPNQICIKF